MSAQATAWKDGWTAPREARPGDRFRWRVLVVDDDAATRRTVMRVLVEASYDVVEASNAEDAIKLLWRTSRRGESIDLVLWAVEMAGGHVPSGLTELLQDHAHPPLIVMATSMESGVFRDAMQLGADAVLPKPLDLELLVLAVQVRIPL